AVNLSKVPHRDKCEYLRMLLPTLARLRRTTGLPHKILLDEAHYFLRDADVSPLIDLELGGYILVTYPISSLPATLRQLAGAVGPLPVETAPVDSRAGLGMCRAVEGVSVSVFPELGATEAAPLPGAAEGDGQVRRFRLAPRLTALVRRRTKYLDVSVSDAQAF